MSDLSDDPRIRILYCLTCKTLDELPMAAAGSGYADVLLETLCQRHQNALGDPHRGHLFDVSIRTWADKETRKKIVDQLAGGGSKGLAEIDPRFYDSKSIFADDAMLCYRKHLRPKGRCPDWKDATKILRPDTKAERKEAGLAATTSHIFLCDFCPAKSYMMSKRNNETGASS